jgi:hypothetical protein
VVRWRTRSGSHHVIATIDYSSDGGRTWKTVLIKPDRGRAMLPSYYFPQSRDARLRVRVNDGFNEGAVISRPFVSLGSPPQVHIFSPTRTQRIMDDASLYLSGVAFDDRSRPLTGHALRWYAGRRLLGSGAAISVTSLPPGADTIRLVATDAAGRSTVASTLVRVMADQPRLLVLRAPKRIRPSAVRVHLAVSASLPARLVVAGQRFRVGRRLQRFVVRVQPGHRSLELTLVLRAFGKRSMTPLTIRR